MSFFLYYSQYKYNTFLQILQVFFRIFFDKKLAGTVSAAARKMILYINPSIGFKNSQKSLRSFLEYYIPGFLPGFFILFF